MVGLVGFTARDRGRHLEARVPRAAAGRAEGANPSNNPTSNPATPCRRTDRPGDSAHRRGSHDAGRRTSLAPRKPSPGSPAVTSAYQTMRTLRDLGVPDVATPAPDPFGR